MIEKRKGIDSPMGYPVEIKAILIDDELNAIKNLSKLLSDYCPLVNIIGASQDVPVAIAMINSLRPDVIFLDISMPRETGFDLLNKLQYLPIIVFVTAHDKFALRAIKLCALDFILKPVHPNDLIKAVEKIKVILSLQDQMELQQNYRDVYNNLSNHLHNSGVAKKICIPTFNGQGYSVLQTDEIIHIKGEDNYTIFNLVSNNKVVVSKTLKEYEELLDGFGFLRIHKSSIINLNHLVETIKNGELNVIMSNGNEIPVSRRRGPLLLKKLKQLS